MILLASNLNWKTFATILLLFLMGFYIIKVKPFTNNVANRCIFIVICSLTLINITIYLFVNLIPPEYSSYGYNIIMGINASNAQLLGRMVLGPCCRQRLRRCCTRVRRCVAGFCQRIRRGGGEGHDEPLLQTPAVRYSVDGISTIPNCQLKNVAEEPSANVAD